MNAVAVQVAISNYCTCSYFEESSDGTTSTTTIVQGKPCAIHPNGCEHGVLWFTPCEQCFRVSLDPGPKANAVRKYVDRIEDLSAEAYHDFNHIDKFELGMQKLRQIAKLSATALAAYDTQKT